MEKKFKVSFTKKKKIYCVKLEVFEMQNVKFPQLEFFIVEMQ